MRVHPDGAVREARPHPEVHPHAGAVRRPHVHGGQHPPRHAVHRPGHALPHARQAPARHHVPQTRPAQEGRKS